MSQQMTDRLAMIVYTYMYILTMEYYLKIKRNEVQITCFYKRMNLENIRQSERTSKKNRLRFYLQEISRVVICRVKKYICGCLGLGEGLGYTEQLLTGMKSLYRMVKMF